MGICTLTELNGKYQKFIPDYPFINVNKGTLKDTLNNLIKNEKKIFNAGKKAKIWVNKRHNIKEVGNKLYNYYKSIGLKI